MLNDNQAFDTCFTCGKAITLDVCEPHPTRADIELRNFRCASCGHVKTVAVSLRARTLPPEMAA
jgi:DNA-directed RNA polymerase subunit RPC12/RpoP